MLSLRGILSWDLDERLGLVLHRQVISHVNPQNPRNQAKKSTPAESNPKLQFQLWALHLGFRFGGAVGFRLQDFGFRVSASTVNRIPQRLAHSLYVCMYIQTYMHKCIHTCIYASMHAYIPTYLPTYIHTPIYIISFLASAPSAAKKLRELAGEWPDGLMEFIDYLGFKVQGFRIQVVSRL